MAFILRDNRVSEGIPEGGGTGESLVKLSINDFDTDWGVATEAESARLLRVTVKAGQTVSALKLVRFTDPDYVEHADCFSTFEDSNATGVSLNGGPVNTDIDITLFGRIEDPSFTFPLNAPLFLGANGEIVLLPPIGAVYNMQIGKSLGNGSIFVDIKEPILL